MLPDDFLGRVPLDALRPGVPSGNAAVRVEQENGVVLHTVNQQAKSLLAFAQRFLGLLAFGQVASDFQESAHAAIAISQGGEYDVCPKPASVLAQPPALVLKSPVLRRSFQFRCGPPAGDRLFGVKAVEGLADDLVGLVAFDALGSRIPTQHCSFSIEHENGVVLDACYQLAEVLVDLTQFVGIRWHRSCDFAAEPIAGLGLRSEA